MSPLRSKISSPKNSPRGFFKEEEHSSNSQISLRNGESEAEYLKRLASARNVPDASGNVPQNNGKNVPDGILKLPNPNSNPNSNSNSEVDEAANALMSSMGIR